MFFLLHARLGTILACSDGSETQGDNCPGLPETVLVSALNAPHPENTFGPRQQEGWPPRWKQTMGRTLKTGHGKQQKVWWEPPALPFSR